jgi:hypothetical protein
MDRPRIRPSKAAVWVNCTGYPVLAARYPSTFGPAALEGLDAHWVGEQVFKGIRPESLVGLKGPNGFMISPEMLRFVKMYTDEVTGIGHAVGALVNTETRYNCSSIHPDNNAVIDTWLLDERQNVLHIWDFKYGWTLVEPYENWQLLNYYAGIIQAIGIPDHGLTVSFNIVQPRAPHPEGPIRNWTVKAVELRPYVNKLHMSAHEALSDNAKCVAGPWCALYCEARHACPAASASACAAIDIAYSPAPFEMDAAGIARELHTLAAAKRAIEQRWEGLSSHALAIIRQGKLVPGWAGEPTVGNKEWSKPEAEVRMLGKLYDVDITKVMTPTQACDAGIPADIIGAYSTRTKKSLKLVVDNKAAKIFGGKKI